MENEILFGAAGFALGLVLHILWKGLRPRFARWHRRLWRFYWRWRSRRRGGRPPLDPELIALIRQMCWENPLWGAPRIHGELLKLGFTLAQSTVSKYMLRRRGPPGGGSWAAFLAEHADAIAAVDFLTAPSLLFGRLYAFVVLAHGRRRIFHVEVTSHPSALWLACQIAEAFRLDPAPLFLIRDNDGLYGATFRDELRKLGIDDRPTAPVSTQRPGETIDSRGSLPDDRRLGQSRMSVDTRACQGFARWASRRAQRTHRRQANPRRTAPPIRAQARKLSFRKAQHIVADDLVLGALYNTQNACASPFPS